MKKKAIFAKKQGFTLIELLVVIGIIAILATMILVNISQSRQKARVNGAKTSLKMVIPGIIACIDGGGGVRIPAVTETGLNSVCLSAAAGLDGANWPMLPSGYQYVAGLGYNSISCNFAVFTNGDSTANLTCNCLTQVCE